MEKLSKRILIKICSTRPYQWVVRKIVTRMVRRAQKAPEVQERIKALQAAAPGEQSYALFEYRAALGNEIAKSKWVNYDPEPPEVMQMMRFQGLLLPRIERGNATASEIEEFRRLAEEVLRDPQYPPQRKQRIEAALRTAKPRP